MGGPPVSSCTSFSCSRWRTRCRYGGYQAFTAGIPPGSLGRASPSLPHRPTLLPWSLGLTSVPGSQAKGSSGPSGDASRTTSILHQRVQDLEDENQSLNTRSWMLQKLLDAHIQAAASPGAEQVASSLDPVLSLLSTAPGVCSLLLTCSSHAGRQSASCSCTASFTGKRRRQARRTQGQSPARHSARDPATPRSLSKPVHHPRARALSPVGQSRCHFTAVVPVL